jgi:NADPH-dependent 2,4-dienoyl-CoA reductase/sulfur reductase-like enzyme
MVFQHSHLAAKLGCKLDSNDIVEVNDFKQTSVAGVYAVGDASSPLSQISWAVASGMLAASFVSRSQVTGKTFDVPFSHIWFLKDGQIAKLNHYVDTFVLDRASARDKQGLPFSVRDR